MHISFKPPSKPAFFTRDHTFYVFFWMVLAFDEKNKLDAALIYAILRLFISWEIKGALGVSMSDEFVKYKGYNERNIRDARLNT